ncbi:MAG: metalloregulator ArsR/SmtB family transcription factor [Crocinitomicaceae bacterium]|nr:metalloregulator ArsR/SmtB family transcription factor [Crocinitomicaceae bacterium]
MDKRAFKNRIYSEISSVAKAISNPNRLEIIDFIANGAKSVEDIALQTEISIANASQHLQTLKKERLVQTTKKGNQVFYALSSIEVYRAWKSLRELTLSSSSQVSDIMVDMQENFDYDSSYHWNDIKERKDIYLLDVRPEDEFAQNHISRATSIPLKELNDRLTEIPKNKLIITYCRGMFCLMADEAVKILHSNGFNARKIEESALDSQIDSGL